jgi:hypothetical protein
VLVALASENRTMPEDPSIASVVIALEVGSDPIVGVLEDGARSTPFVGWLDLISALERFHQSGRTNPLSPENPEVAR